MIKLFKYELKRMLFNKFFLGLLVLTALYSYQIMTGDIILGVANTAPFSSWSYGEYLSVILPILLVTLLFFISFLYSKQEKRVQILTKAAPINPFRFMLLRYGAIVIAFILIAAVPIGFSLWFYKAIFHFTNFSGFVLPIVIVLLPTLLFGLGLGVFAGQIHPTLIFVLMPLALLISNLQLSYTTDLFCTNFFSSYPATLNIVEPSFTVPMSLIASRCIYCTLGFVLIVIATLRNKNNPLNS